VRIYLVQIVGYVGMSCLGLYVGGYVGRACLGHDVDYVG